ncbi:hypothetical protein E2320_002326, partial [Naja naja]
MPIPFPYQVPSQAMQQMGDFPDFQVPPQAIQHIGGFPKFQGPYSPVSSKESESSLSEEEGQLDKEMLENEGLTPDQPSFTGPFRPHLFKSLLFKAKNTARVVNVSAVLKPALTMVNPDEPYLHVPVQP